MVKGEKLQFSPIHEALANAGAVFENEDGRGVVSHYGDPLGEYRRARDDVVLFDVSHRGKIEVSDKDAASFLHNLSTNDVKSLAAGAGCEAFLTTGQAKIVAHVWIYRTSESATSNIFWLDMFPGLAGKVAQHLDRYLISEQVAIADRTLDFGQLYLAGPRAGELLARIGVEQVPDNSILSCSSKAMVAHDSVQIQRNDLLGISGYALISPADRTEAVFHMVHAAGASLAGNQCYNMLRVEAGTPAYGVDIDESNLPHEVGRIDRAVSFTKGCYIGQETVARIRTYGHVNRSLAGIKLMGAECALHGVKILRDGKEVGFITSSVYSPRVGTAVALGYVRRGSEVPGTIVEVEMHEGRYRGEVARLPF
jgi:tRNA-modifying protein YgfZ